MVRNASNSTITDCIYHFQILNLCSHSTSDNSRHGAIARNARQPATSSRVVSLFILITVFFFLLPRCELMHMHYDANRLEWGSHPRPQIQTTEHKHAQTLSADDLGMLLLHIHECRQIIWKNRRRFRGGLLRNLTEDLAELAGERCAFYCISWVFRFI